MASQISASDSPSKRSRFTSVQAREPHLPVAPEACFCFQPSTSKKACDSGL